MTTYVGDHIHLVDNPDIDLEIDVIPKRRDGAPSWYAAHDRAGVRYYVCAEEIEPHGTQGRHRCGEDTVPAGRHRREDIDWPVITGDLTEPAPAIEPVVWWRTERAHQLACRIGDLWERLIAIAAVVALLVLGVMVTALVAAAFWLIQPILATLIGALGIVLLGLGIYLLCTSPVMLR